DLRLGAAEGTQEVDRVAAGVHHRAAGQVEPVPDVTEPWQRKAQPGLYVADRPDGVDELQRPGGQRVVPVVERLHHDQPAGLGGVRDLPGLAGVGGHRLLAQHVLTGGDRGERPLRVQRVRQRDVDRVDLRILDDLGVRAVYDRDVVAVGEGAGAGRVARR